jgi:hypothetical protein
MARRFFFVHVMKTGGTSLVLHMLANFAPEEVYPSEKLDRRRPDDPEPYASIADLRALGPGRRASIRLYTGHMPFMMRELIGPDVVTLSLLREPVARTVSVLKHFKRLFPVYSAQSLDEVYDDPFVFHHFVENHQTRMFALTSDDAPRAFASNISYREIRAALDDPATRRAGAERAVVAIDDARLELAMRNLARVDVLGVSDDYPAFAERLHARYGWWPDGLNFAARAHVSTEPWNVTDALRERIAADNAYDIALYARATELVAGGASTLTE